MIFVAVQVGGNGSPDTAPASKPQVMFSDILEPLGFWGVPAFMLALSQAVGSLRKLER